MTDEQKAAYVHAQSVCALAEIEGMRADNEQKKIDGESGLREGILHSYGLPWSKDDFEAVIEKYGIHSNAVGGFFHG